MKQVWILFKTAEEGVIGEARLETIEGVFESTKKGLDRIESITGTRETFSKPYYDEEFKDMVSLALYGPYEVEGD